MILLLGQRFWFRKLPILLGMVLSWITSHVRLKTLLASMVGPWYPGSRSVTENPRKKRTPENMKTANATTKRHALSCLAKWCFKIFQKMSQLWESKQWNTHTHILEQGPVDECGTTSKKKGLQMMRHGPNFSNLAVCFGSGAWDVGCIWLHPFWDGSLRWVLIVAQNQRSPAPGLKWQARLSDSHRETPSLETCLVK